MPIVAAYLYRDGQRVSSILPDAPVIPAASEFIWIGLVEPDAQELRGLQNTFGLHPLAVEDAVKAHQLPKLDIYGEQLFVVARTAHLEQDKILYGETAIFVGPRHIITVRHGSARGHASLRTQMEAAPRLLAHGVDYVLHGILDFIVDGYTPIMDSVEDDVLDMEKNALQNRLKRDELARLFTLRREMTRFQRSLAPMAEVVSKLVHLDLPCVDAEVRPYFKDVLDHVRRADNMVGSLRDVLTSVFEVSALLEQQRQGDITRRLAAWAAILAVPTAIAGIYGMNFEYMPELRSPYGYPMVLGVIATICSLLYLRLKRAGWL